MSSLDMSSLLGVPELSQYLQQVDQGITKTLTSGNPNINKPLSRILKAHGKRLRPTMLIAVAVSQGQKVDDKVISACIAIELAHIGSLVHDDVIDKAETRWNNQTINSLEGSDNAIVIGDYLIAKACAEGARVSAEVGEKIALAIVDLCDGQSREMADRLNLNRTKEEYLRAISGKTASLISATCEIGGICAGLDKDKINSLASYGKNFGISFQLIDDLVDILSTPELLGKPIGNDIKEDVYTLPVILSLHGAHRDKVKAKLADKNELATSELASILLGDSSIERTITLIRNYNQLAVEALYGLEDSKLIKSLLDFPDNYLNWSLKNLIAKTYIPSISNL